MGVFICFLVALLVTALFLQYCLYLFFSWPGGVDAPTNPPQRHQTTPLPVLNLREPITRPNPP